MENNPARDNLLLTEFTQNNEYCRSSFGLLVNWFTFFLTINYAAIGWFVGTLIEHKIKSTSPVYFLGGFFILQNILAVCACFALKHFFVKTFSANERIQKDLLQEGADFHNRNPIPIEMYKKVLLLMKITLFSVILFWGALIYKTGQIFTNYSKEEQVSDGKLKVIVEQLK